MKRVFILLVVLLITASPGMAQDDNVLVMARGADAVGLDPHLQTAFASLRLLELVYEPLLRTDEELEIIPALAEGWEFSEDGTQLVFTLREGVTFHDGSDFTSEDVVASLNRILDEETGSATRSNLLSIESIEAPDDYTVILNLTLPDVPLVAALASINTAILPSELIESGDPSTTVVGTGPFKLESWEAGVQTVLSANEDYWGDGPFIDGIEIRIMPEEAEMMEAFQAGELDFAIFNDPLIAAQPLGEADATVNFTPALDYHVLQLRAVVEPLDQLEVRQAISCAIDRQQVINEAADGQGIVTGPLTIPLYQIDLDELFCYEQDIDRAKALMAEAGLEDGFTLEVIVASAEPPTAEAEAESIGRQLAEINIDVEIEVLPLDEYVQRWLAGDFMAAIALNGGRPDPYTMYARYWIKDAQFANTAGYIDDTLDSLMKQGQVETDIAARYDIFAEFQQHLAEVSPWVWLYTGFLYSGQQNYLTDFVPSPTGSLFGLSRVQMDK
jgi:peptide/nickel transport system substrate-binding protein